MINLVFRFQNELPERIRSRGKNAHLVHEELVQAMKWKQSVNTINGIYFFGYNLQISNCKLLIFHLI